MKNRFSTAALTVALFGLGASRSLAEPIEGEALWFAGDDAAVCQLVSRGFYDEWVADRLTVGIRIGKNHLTDGKRPGNYEQDFVGAIYRLDDDDDIVVYPELRYWVARHFRFTLGMDSAGGRTRNFNTPNHHSDGTATVKGPLFLVEAVYPMLDDTLLLHAGAGLTWGFGDFDYVTWWHLGHSSEASWKARGSRTNRTRAGYYRQMNVDDALGVAVSCGLAWRPTDRVELDFSVRHVWIEPDCHWGYQYDDHFEEHQVGEFTLDHLQVSAMLSYVF